MLDRKRDIGNEDIQCDERQRGNAGPSEETDLTQPKSWSENMHGLI
jgi:hypothetical protein